jgi:hypothetical protein
MKLAEAAVYKRIFMAYNTIIRYCLKRTATRELQERSVAENSNTSTPQTNTEIPDKLQTLFINHQS